MQMNYGSSRNLPYPTRLRAPHQSLLFHDSCYRLHQHDQIPVGEVSDAVTQHTTRPCFGGGDRAGSCPVATAAGRERKDGDGHGASISNPRIGEISSRTFQTAAHFKCVQSMSQEESQMRRDTNGLSELPRKKRRMHHFDSAIPRCYCHSASHQQQSSHRHRPYQHEWLCYNSKGACVCLSRRASPTNLSPCIRRALEPLPR